MELTAAIQEALLAILCYDDSQQGCKMVKTIVPVKAYDVYYKDLASTAVDYIEKYGKAPGEHMMDLVETLKSRFPDSGEIYDKIFHSLLQTKDSINREYIISQASLFARKQRMKLGITQAIEILEKDDSEQALNEAQTILDKGKIDSYNLFDPGTIVTDTKRSLAFLDDEEDVFPTGIKEIDELELGPARKAYHLMMAPPGRGKSRWLTKLLKHSFMAGKKTLYVTLEMSEKKVTQRIIQSFFSITKREQEVLYKRFTLDDLGRFIDFKDINIGKRPNFRQPDIRSHLIKKLKPLQNRPPIVVKEFPTGCLTIEELKAYLDALEGSINFIPDLLIIDYADLMKIDSRNEREELSRIGKELRGIGVARNMAVASASQSNREGEDARVLKGKHVGGDYSKNATADVIFTYNQTDAEHKLGLARLYVLKGRNDRDHFQLLISQCYDIGEFCTASAQMVDSTYWGVVDGAGPDEEESSESH